MATRNIISIVFLLRRNRRINPTCSSSISSNHLLDFTPPLPLLSQKQRTNNLTLTRRLSYDRLRLRSTHAAVETHHFCFWGSWFEELCSNSTSLVLFISKAPKPWLVRKREVHPDAWSQGLGIKKTKIAKQARHIPRTSGQGDPSLGGQSGRVLRYREHIFAIFVSEWRGALTQSSRNSTITFTNTFQLNS